MAKNRQCFPFHYRGGHSYSDECDFEADLCLNANDVQNIDPDDPHLEDRLSDAFDEGIESNWENNQPDSDSVEYPEEVADEVRDWMKKHGHGAPGTYTRKPGYAGRKKKKVRKKGMRKKKRVGTRSGPARPVPATPAPPAPTRPEGERMRDFFFPGGKKGSYMDIPSWRKKPR